MKFARRSTVCWAWRTSAPRARQHPSSTGFVQKISRSGQHLLGVINDILDFSKIDAGKMHIESNCLNPTQLAEEALSMLKEKADSKRA